MSTSHIEYRVILPPKQKDVVRSYRQDFLRNFYPLLLHLEGTYEGKNAYWNSDDVEKLVIRLAPFAVANGVSLEGLLEQDKQQAFDGHNNDSGFVLLAFDTLHSPPRLAGARIVFLHIDSELVVVTGKTHQYPGLALPPVPVLTSADRIHKKWAESAGVAVDSRYGRAGIFKQLIIFGDHLAFHHLQAHELLGSIFPRHDLAHVEFTDLTARTQSAFKISESVFKPLGFQYCGYLNASGAEMRDGSGVGEIRQQLCLHLKEPGYEAPANMQHKYAHFHTDWKKAPTPF